MPSSLADLEAWENAMFDEYNGEGRMTQEEFEANAYDELEEAIYE